jgi:Ca2+-binding RTX toxin-like protein
LTLDSDFVYSGIEIILATGMLGFSGAAAQFSEFQSITAYEVRITQGAGLVSSMPFNVQIVSLPNDGFMGDFSSPNTVIATINGGSDNDTIWGPQAPYSSALFNQVTILGGDGSDTILGGAMRDLIHGNAGDDTIYCGGGNDQIYDDFGTDTYYGGEGDDSLIIG